MRNELTRRMVVGGMVATTAVAMQPLVARAQGAGVVREDIKIAAEGGAIDAYLAAPAGQAKGPGVIVVTHVMGVDQDTKNMCDELAERGCVALAQNFFWRDQDPGVLTEAEVPRAIARATRIDFPRSMGELALAIEEVKRHPNFNGRVVLLGYCFGGPYAWRAACDEGFDIYAAVSFHGTFVSRYMKPGDAPNCPVSFHYGDKDELAPPEELAKVKAVADATGSEFVIHPGAGHAYMMPANSHYHAEAARNSWKRALEMIDQVRS